MHAMRVVWCEDFTWFRTLRGTINIRTRPCKSTDRTGVSFTRLHAVLIIHAEH